MQSDQIVDDVIRQISRCSICFLGFSPDQWDVRHSGVYGEELHEDCCERRGPCAKENGRHREP